MILWKQFRAYLNYGGTPSVLDILAEHGGKEWLSHTDYRLRTRELFTSFWENNCFANVENIGYDA